MTETTPPSSAGGLRGQSAGSTAICTVGKAGVGLTYRGYSIEDLAEKATFEEVAFLLLQGQLPNAQQLGEFNRRLKKFRFLPPALKEVLEKIPKNSHPMDGSSLPCHPCSATGIASVAVKENESNWIRMRRIWPAIF
jgi:2-methylcitrate synthase